MTGDENMLCSGGLAEVTTTQTDQDRCTLKVGNVRVLDIIGRGKDIVIECKGAKHDPVRADPQMVLQMISSILSRLNA